MKYLKKTLLAGIGSALLTVAVGSVLASSHMDAPLISLDPAANITDVYAFRNDIGDIPYLAVAMSVYPFEEPGIGPNYYDFDDDVRYDIHVSVGDDVATGKSTIAYEFRFRTTVNNPDTYKTFADVVGATPTLDGCFPRHNICQTYTVTRTDQRTGASDILGSGVVPPNNQGISTPLYNEDNGNGPALGGVNDPDVLDEYTKNSIMTAADGTQVFAGQRDDGFYADIQAIFDLINLRNNEDAVDSQKGFNVHTIAVNIPLGTLGETDGKAGVHATTSRQRVKVLPLNPGRDPRYLGKFVQVGRAGNPLFNEGFVAIKDKDLYNRTKSTKDEALFVDYAVNPELAEDLGLPSLDRDDIRLIYIPDVIKLDLTTGPVRLAGDPGFDRLSIFGGDILTNAAGVDVPGGWPNGRRFGDDVLDIAVRALAAPATIPADQDVDGVLGNDTDYLGVFPYAGTPHNGRNHQHDRARVATPDPDLQAEFLLINVIPETGVFPIFATLGDCLIDRTTGQVFNFTGIGGGPICSLFPAGIAGTGVLQHHDGLRLTKEFVDGEQLTQEQFEAILFGSVDR